LPSKWWEKIKLSNNYTKALEQVDNELKYYGKFMLHKNKQRLTRLTQVNIRIRKLAKEDERIGERLVPRLAPKVRRREDGRERKALAAAKVERAIERVLIDRLRSGAYGDRPLNVEANVWKRVMAGLEKEGQATRDEDLDDGLLEEDEEENEYEMENGVGDVEYVSDIEGESDDDLEDFEDWVDGQSPDEADDDDDDEDSDSASGGDEEEDASEDEVVALQKKLASLKRKRPAAPPAKPKKKPSRDPKGPRMEIEIEREPAARERQLVRN
jgi:protein MAK16